MRNAVSFIGTNTAFKTFLDDATEKVNNAKKLEFPYYKCSNCGFSAWTIKNNIDNYKCGKCESTVEVITERNDASQTDKHTYNKKYTSMEEEHAEKQTKLVSTRYGFKRIKR